MPLATTSRLSGALAGSRSGQLECECAESARRMCASSSRGIRRLVAVIWDRPRVGIDSAAKARFTRGIGGKAIAKLVRRFGSVPLGVRTGRSDRSLLNQRRARATLHCGRRARRQVCRLLSWRSLPVKTNTAGCGPSKVKSGMKGAACRA